MICQVVQYHGVARINSIGSGKKLDTIFDGISLKENNDNRVITYLAFFSKFPLLSEEIRLYKSKFRHQNIALVSVNLQRG